MRWNKKAKVGMFFVALALSLTLLFMFAQNAAGDVAFAVEVVDVVENNSSLSLPVVEMGEGESILGEVIEEIIEELVEEIEVVEVEGVPAAEEDLDKVEGELIEVEDEAENDLDKAEDEIEVDVLVGSVVFREIELDDYTFVQDRHNNTFSYELEQGNLADGRVVSRVHMEDIVESFEFVDFDEAKFIISTDIGRIVSSDFIFAESFFLDTIDINFAAGSFTKIAGGSVLYSCENWSFEQRRCLGEWVFIKYLEIDEEYTQTIEPEQNIVYGEFYSPLEHISLREAEILSNNQHEINIQAAISNMAADGLVSYVPTAPGTTFNHRTWNASTNSFTSAVTESQTFTDPIEWTVLKANHERDEFIMGTLTSGTIRCAVMVYNVGANSWGNFLQLTPTCGSNAALRPIDIAYEQLSGDALIVFESDTGAGASTLNYTIWNGSAYSTQAEVDFGAPIGDINFVQAIAKTKTDDIMVLGLTENNDVFAILWNGTSFENPINITLTASVNTAEPFHFAWEGTSGDGLVAYGENGAEVDLRTYDATNKVWGGAIVNAIDVGPQEPEKIRVCSDPNSNDIGIIVGDSGNDVSVRIWDGSTIEAAPAPPSDDTSTEATAAGTMPIGCAFNGTNGAVFMFIDSTNSNDEEISYTTYGQTAWSGAALEDATLSTQVDPDSGSIENLYLDINPVTDEVMVMASDSEADLNSIIYNNSWFTISASPLDSSLECLDDTNCMQFAWTRYDPVPNVSLVFPSGSNFDVSATVAINVTVEDNINEDVVLANITLPNGTINQITLANTTNRSFYNATFSTTDLNGIYTIRIIANDTSSYQNINSSETVIFTVGDVINPNVTNITPVVATNFPLNTVINISANVTDEVNVSQVFADITLPNSTIEQITLSNTSLIYYNGTFSTTGTAGTYTVRIIANDTSNNTNSSETTTLTIGDVIFPNVTNVTPANGTNFEAGSTINITVNVTDESAVDSVLANVTLPNSSIEQITLTNISLANYNNTFNTTGATGTYTVLIIANDTTNNVNASQTTTFTIGDTVAPSITLNTPTNNTNTSDTSVTFNFTATDNSGVAMVCNLTLNGIVNQTNTSVVSGANTLIPVTGFVNGANNWNITCNDSSANINTSITRVFTVDTLPVTFVSLTTAPSSSADLDPGVLINVTANVTDNVTGVGVVIFQYKLENESTYTNITMTLNTTSLVFNATFNATQAGIYNLRLQANDTVGNSDTSELVNITVQEDRTWGRTPSTFTIVSNASLNVTVGNLTINNTGDVPLFFNITSNSNYTLYNDSSTGNITNVTLAAGAFVTIQINDTAPVAGLKIITLNISTNDSATNADSLLTTANIVVAPGQPILLATFTTPDTETLSVSQGDTSRSFVANLENIGEANATNVTFFLEIPNEWEVTLGQTNLTFQEFNIRDKEENTIEVTIPTNASTGEFIIVANATGINGSGVDLHTVDLIFEDTVTVTVGEVAVLGSSPGGGGSSSSSSSSASASTGGGGSGGGGGGLVKSVQISEEIVHIKRGEKQAIPVMVTNLFPNTTLTNVRLNLSGFLTQYISVEPESIAELEYLEAENFSLSLLVPVYFTESEYLLRVIITADRLVYDETNDVTIRDQFKQIRELILKVEESSAREVGLDLRAVERLIQEMREAGFFVDDVENLLRDASSALDIGEFTTASELLAQIEQIHATAFEAQAIIEEVRAGVLKAQQKWLETPQSDEALELALLAFNRGDFSTALERAKNAQLILVLEVKGRINIFKFIVDWWWALLLSLVVLLIALYFTYKFTRVAIISQRLNSLKKEEETLGELLEETQKKYLVDKSLSATQYKRYTQQYEKRVTKIHQIRAKLRNKRVAILKTAQEVKNIKKEHLEVEKLLRVNQTSYFIQGKISRRKFLSSEKLYKARLAEIEREEEILNEKLGRQKGGRWYRLFSFFSGRSKVEYEVVGEEKLSPKKKPVVKRTIAKKIVKKKTAKKKTVKKIIRKVSRKQVKEESSQQEIESSEQVISEPVLKQEVETVKEEVEADVVKQEPVKKKLEGEDIEQKENKDSLPPQEVVKPQKEDKVENLVDSTSLMKIFDAKVPKLLGGRNVDTAPLMQMFDTVQSKKQKIKRVNTANLMKIFDVVPSTIQKMKSADNATVLKQMFVGVSAVSLAAREKRIAAIKKPVEGEVVERENTIKQEQSKKRITNTTRSDGVRRMSEEELRKQFPGAFK